MASPRHTPMRLTPAVDQLIELALIHVVWHRDDATGVRPVQEQVSLVLGRVPLLLNVGHDRGDRACTTVGVEGIRSLLQDDFGGLERYLFARGAGIDPADEVL